MTPMKTAKTGGEEKSPRRSPRFQSKTTLRRSPRLKKRRESKETNHPRKSQTKTIKEVRFAKSVDTRLQRSIKEKGKVVSAVLAAAAVVVVALVIGLFMYKQKS